jgi:23S rRNA (uracil1939-C5)-methyltransferase
MLDINKNRNDINPQRAPRNREAPVPLRGPSQRRRKPVPAPQSKIKWPIEKGSIRLRAGPHGEKGVWLDFANIDIKKILDEKEILKSLQKIAFVEMGQRRKVPVWNGTEFKLQDPELNIWFQTWMNDVPVDLFCHVASFTQPSLKANKLIADKISSWVNRYPDVRLIEFGSGIGNLTLPALATASSVLACEIDALSLEGLEKTVSHLPSSLKDSARKLKIYRGDFQKKILQDFSQFDGVLANPPRSGLMSFLNPLEELESSQRPPFFIYMSCFPESMALDMERLQKYGYEISELAILDQFPQTHHYEVLGLLQRK